MRPAHHPLRHQRGLPRLRRPSRRWVTGLRSWPRAALLAGLLAALVLAAAPVGAQTPDTLRATEFSDRPVRTPESVKTGIQAPSQGFEFGVGHPAHTVTIDGVKGELEPGNGLLTNGALLTADFLLGAFRLGYTLQIFRQELPEPQTVEGEQVSFASFEGHQLWVFHGVRPWRALYLGYGLGLQNRSVRLYEATAVKVQQTDSLVSAGVLVDYRFSTPYSVQLRWTQDLQTAFAGSDGASLHLSYYVPF